uniref:Myb-like domain-containing protein n=1 Tax=Bionectria ochroleuca TaxID=29856 RepID=A0A8H7TUG8_BIOOC
MSASQVQEGHDSEHDVSSPIRPNPNFIREFQNRGILRVRLSNLQGLREASDELVSAIRTYETQGGKSSHLDLDVKIGVLKSRLIAYQEDREDHEDLFIPSSLIAELAESDSAELGLAGEDLDILQVLGNANLATAMNLLQRIRFGDDDYVLSSLEKLDDYFDELFAPFGNESQNTRQAINLRTSVFIHKLGPVTEEIEPYPVIAEVFCKAGDAENPEDYETLFEQGPFKPLGMVHGEDPNAICIERIQDIIQLLEDERKEPGSLGRAYDTGEILQGVQDWIWEVYQANKNELSDRKAEAQQASASRDIFHDAEERPGAEDTQSTAESQPIIRLKESQPRQSLFQGAQSLQVLHDTSQPIERPEETQPRKSLFEGAQSFHALINPAHSRKTTIPPPSSQQQEAASQTPPADYDNDNEAILGPPPPSNDGVAASEPPASVNAEAQGEEEPEDESDDGDAFEEDSRPAKDKDRVVVHHIGPKQARASRAAQLMPPPPRPTPASTAQPRSSPSEPPPSSLRSVSTASSHGSSVFHPSSSFKSRQPWSSNDTNLLVDLVHAKQAKWSKIEEDENHRFEHPRNQQAYRDKARNLKVEYLLSDRVLPPSFNLVALSKKEIDRLISFGKNPYRKEDDLDDDGNPIGTEYARPGEFS